MANKDTKEVKIDTKPEETIKPEEVKKVCFLATPLGDELSTTRKAVDGLIEAVLEPVLKEFGFELVAPHRIPKPGSITKQVIRYLLGADLVIANLTELNANVMYELAVRHAKRLPIITIAQNGTRLPFDVAAERTLFFDNDMSGVIKLTNSLRTMIPVAMADESPENPIYDGQESLIIRESIHKAGTSDVQEYILDQLELINNQIKALSTQPDSARRNMSANIGNIIEINSPSSEYGVLLHFKAPSRDKVEQIANTIAEEMALNKNIGIHYFTDTEASVGFRTIKVVNKELLGLLLAIDGGTVIKVDFDK